MASLALVFRFIYRERSFKTLLTAADFAIYDRPYRFVRYRRYTKLKPIQRHHANSTLDGVRNSEDSKEGNDRCKDAHVG